MIYFPERNTTTSDGQAFWGLGGCPALSFQRKILYTVDRLNIQQQGQNVLGQSSPGLPLSSIPPDYLLPMWQESGDADPKSGPLFLPNICTLFTATESRVLKTYKP
jgi:hypothetical protein